MSKSLISGFYPGGETVLNIETIVQKCITVAGNIYDIDISFKSKSTNIFVLGSAKEIVPEIAQMLDYVCLSGRDVVVELEEDEANRMAYLTIMSGQSVEKEILSFELYRGIPDSVISDIDTEEDLDECIKDSFEKVNFVRKKLGEIKR